MADASKQEPPWTAWPFGHDDRHSDDLLGRLIRVGAHHARRARELYTSEKYEEQVDAAISAGLALEMMAKACVAKINPVLLAGRAPSIKKELGVQDAILRLTDNHHLSTRTTENPHDFNTISASEAVTAAVNFDRVKDLPSKGTDSIINARDQPFIWDLWIPHQSKRLSRT